MASNSRNTIGFNGNACFAAVRKIADGVMDLLSGELQDIFKEQIAINGNGSSIMVESAVAQVKEVSREATDELIKLSVGIDEESLRSMSLELYVRVMVVLHGNQANGHIWTKPGQPTFKKHVVGPTVNRTGNAEDAYPIPQFDWPVDVSEYIVENSLKRIESVIREALDMIYDACNSAFFESFVTVS